jgi:hypothetical protein
MDQGTELVTGGLDWGYGDGVPVIKYQIGPYEVDGVLESLIDGDPEFQRAFVEVEPGSELDTSIRGALEGYRLVVKAYRDAYGNWGDEGPLFQVGNMVMGSMATFLFG